MKNFVLTSGCKVNFFLKVGQKLADGYHLLTSFFYPLSTPYDKISITILPQDCFELDSNLSCLIQNNILEKTFFLFKQASRIKFGCRVFLEKRVPIGAGLGGGSANAAVFLNFLNQHFNFPLSEPALFKLAAQIGADVPFFLWNQPAWVEGIGDKIFPVNFQLKDVYGLLICPKFNVSTVWAYQELDKLREKQKTCLTNMGQKHKEFFSQGMLMFENDFEQVVFAKYPLLRKIKQGLVQQFGWGGLSGSGSSLFFLFKQKTDLKTAKQFLAKFDVLSYSYFFN